MNNFICIIRMRISAVSGGDSVIPYRSAPTGGELVF